MQLFTRVPPIRTACHSHLVSFSSNPPVEPYIALQNGSMKMESLSAFALELQNNDHLLSMDIAKGYRHFRLHPEKQDWFLFRYEVEYYRCVALPFGLGRSPLWFTHLRELRSYGYRVLGYLDDFAVAPTPEPTLGHAAICNTHLWSMRLNCARYAVGSLLYALAVLRHQQHPVARQTRTNQAQPSEHRRSDDVAETHEQRAVGAADGAARSHSSNAYRRCRRGKGWDSESHRFTSWSRWTLAGAGALELAGQGRAYQLPRVQGSKFIATGVLGTEIAHQGHRTVLMHIVNEAFVHITNSFVSSCRPMIRKLRRWKAVLDHLDIHIRSEWIPSVAN